MLASEANYLRQEFVGRILEFEDGTYQSPAL